MHRALQEQEELPRQSVNIFLVLTAAFPDVFLAPVRFVVLMIKAIRGMAAGGGAEGSASAGAPRTSIINLFLVQTRAFPDVFLVPVRFAVLILRALREPP